jgi:hypothetical protein
MLFIIIFFLPLIWCHSNFNPADELMDLEPEDAWECLCAKFRGLKCLDPERRKRLTESPIFQQRMKILKNQIREFFSNSPLEAFTALESVSKDAGMVLFFIRFLKGGIDQILIDHGEIHFSFEEISRSKKLADWEIYLYGTMEYFLNWVLYCKTSELLSVVLRIFQNLKRKIGDALDV